MLAIELKHAKEEAAAARESGGGESSAAAWSKLKCKEDFAQLGAQIEHRWAEGQEWDAPAAVVFGKNQGRRGWMCGIVERSFTSIVATVSLHSDAWSWRWRQLTNAKARRSVSYVDCQAAPEGELGLRISVADVDALCRWSITALQVKIRPETSRERGMECVGCSGCWRNDEAWCGCMAAWRESMDRPILELDPTESLEARARCA